MTKETYLLEYWVDSSSYSRKDLAQKLSEDLQSLDVDCKIEKEHGYYILKITAGQKNIDACHHHLSFDRKEFFRAKDELGEELRLKAYPILAEIETRLRRFITRAMIEVLGFNWWDQLTPKKIRENVNNIEKKSGAKQAEKHHQIEFTMFDDLLSFITGKYQKWPDTKNITSADLSKLLDDCESFEEVKKKVSQKRKQTSLWKGVFSYYFVDKEAWDKLEKRISKIVIPIRNKVMHHRLIRVHDVRKLEECRDELNRVIGTAKPELTKGELKDIANTFKVISKSNLFQIDPKVIQAIQRSAQIDPEIIKAITQTPLIDPEIMRRFTSGINFRLQGFDNKSISGESNEEDPNDDEKSDQNEEDKSDDNEKNDSSDDDMNRENDKS